MLGCNNIMSPVYLQSVYTSTTIMSDDKSMVKMYSSNIDGSKMFNIHKL